MTMVWVMEVAVEVSDSGLDQGGNSGGRLEWFEPRRWQWWWMILVWAMEVAVEVGESAWTSAVATEMNDSGLGYGGSSRCDGK